MSRTKKQKMVETPPVFKTFKPVGIKRSNLQHLALNLDEYEAIRLADYMGLDHKEAAEEMDISRPSFSRLIEHARNKLATFLIEGKALAIEGGNIHFRGNIYQCLQCDHMFNISIENSMNECPSCSSKTLVNLAGGFGHGECCVKNLEQDDENHA